ncbi:MAG: peptidoglycan DD-metalloendopeptidase family protein [Pseudomonadales bacterium]
MSSEVLRRAPRTAAVLVLLYLATGCVTHGRPPVADRSPVFAEPGASYEVQAGDTLYSIAWRFGRDFRALAAANGIRSPYTIYPGQRLRLDARVRATKPQTVPPARAAPPRQAIGWRWPTQAAVQRRFGQGNRGIDYQLRAGERVWSAGGGAVVYAGKGLGGFRFLVIVKHDDSFLSAYSVNVPLQVREGQTIKAGTVLADIEKTGRTVGALHFEVRKDGEPVDPASVIR